MSIQLTAKETIRPAQFEKTEEKIGCWERFKEGIGWIHTKVVWLVLTVGKVLLWPVQIISTLAFKAIGVVWPDFAMRAEIFWTHLMLFGEQATSAAREEELFHQIDALQEENARLREEVETQAMRIEGLQVKDEQQDWERTILEQERDAARKERDQRLEGRTRLMLERNQLKIEKEQLEELLQEKEAVIQEKNKQQIEHDQALQEVEVMRRQIEQGERNEALLEQFRKIDAAYQKREAGELNKTELELQQLIPLYDAQKAAYKEMIEQVLGALPPEHHLQTPLQGILRIFNAEHLERISKEMHYYADLKKSLNELCRATI